MTPVVMIPLALTAGVLSFTSPCCLPLLPGYLAYMTGLPVSARGTDHRSLRVRSALLFVAGFSIVFTVLGTGVALAGSRVARHIPMLTRASGVVLIVAGLLEVAWAIGLKYTDGFTRPLPSVITVLAMIGSVYFLALAVRSIPIGTGYAVWTGIGAVGVAILGMILFDEPRTLLRIISILFIVAGIAGLKLVTA